MGIWKCWYSHINPTFKYKDPRIAWIGNPTSKTVWWRQVPVVCPQKCTPKKNRNRKKPTCVMLTQLNAVVCTREGTLAVCSRPTSWRHINLCTLRMAVVSCCRYFYTVNRNSGNAVLGKKFWSWYRAVMARGIAEKRGEALFVNTHI